MPLHNQKHPHLIFRTLAWQRGLSFLKTFFESDEFRAIGQAPFCSSISSGKTHRNKQMPATKLVTALLLTDQARLVLGRQKFAVTRNGDVFHRKPCGSWGAPDKVHRTARYRYIPFGDGTSQAIHRLVALAFIPQTGPIVRHLDDNGLNNILANLAWGTVKDNADDAEANGRLKRKILRAEWPAIKEARDRGAKLREIAARYNVAISAIHRILGAFERQQCRH